MDEKDIAKTILDAMVEELEVFQFFAKPGVMDTFLEEESCR